MKQEIEVHRVGHLAIGLAFIIFIEIVANNPFWMYPLEGESGSAVELDSLFKIDESIANPFVV